MPLKHIMIFLVTFLKHNSSKISVLADGLLAACESSERISWFIISVKIKQNKHTTHSTSSGKGPLSLSLSLQFLPSSGPHVQLHTGYKKTNSYCETLEGHLQVGGYFAPISPMCVFWRPPGSVWKRPQSRKNMFTLERGLNVIPGKNTFTTIVVFGCLGFPAKINMPLYVVKQRNFTFFRFPCQHHHV